MNTTSRQHFPIRHNPVHLTYRLHGSIPVKYEEELLFKRQKAIDKAHAEANTYPPELAAIYLSNQLFDIEARYDLAMDKYLHSNSNGPYHLSTPAIAREVLASYQFLQNSGAVYVYVICVMPNHVHAVVRCPDELEFVDPGLLMSRHKSFTAKKCNAILGLTGLPFWDKNYYDRTVRNGKFETVMWYVLNNPVKAGLTDDWRKWPYTWLNPEYALLFT